MADDTEPPDDEPRPWEKKQNRRDPPEGDRARSSCPERDRGVNGEPEFCLARRRRAYDRRLDCSINLILVLVLTEKSALASNWIMMVMFTGSLSTFIVRSKKSSSDLKA